MQQTKLIYNALPWEVRAALKISNGWLVGSSPIRMVLGEPIKDYDICVQDFIKYQNTCLYLKGAGWTLSINSLGGFKFVKDTMIIDIWCDELSNHLLIRSGGSSIYHFNKQIYLQY